MYTYKILPQCKKDEMYIHVQQMYIHVIQNVYTCSTCIYMFNAFQKGINRMFTGILFIIVSVWKLPKCT